jgi:DUF1016 N-terminal domain
MALQETSGPPQRRAARSSSACNFRVRVTLMDRGQLAPVDEPIICTMSTKRPKPAMPKKTATASRVAEPAAAVPASSAVGLLPEVRELILTARQTVARGVNAALTMLYWQIGTRVRRDILQEKRAGYGEEVVPTLSAQLVAEFGGSFNEKNLRRMVQFAEMFPDEQILVSLIRELSWTHFIALIPLKDALKRDFYAEMCRVEPWYCGSAVVRRVAPPGVFCAFANEAAAMCSEVGDQIPPLHG